MNSKIERYLTINEIAEFLSVKTDTIRKWILNGKVPSKASPIPYTRIGGSIRFKISEIENWIKEDNKEKKKYGFEQYFRRPTI